MNRSPWLPSFKWHLKWFAVLAGICILALCALKFALKRLPDPYRPKTPAPQTTPWRAQ